MRTATLVIEQRLLPFISSVTSESEMGLVECLRHALSPERSERCQLATLRRAVNALEQSVTERLRELREGAAAELSDRWASIRHSRSSFARRDTPRSDFSSPFSAAERERTVLENGSNLAIVMESSVAQNQAQTTVKRMRTLELEELGLDDSSLSPGSDFLDSSEQKLLSDDSTGSDSSDWIDWTDWIGSKSQSEKSLTAESSEAVPSAIAEEQIRTLSLETLATSSSHSEPVELNVAKPLRAVDITNVEERWKSSLIDEQKSDTKVAKEELEITETLDDLEVFLFEQGETEQSELSEDAEVGFIDLGIDEVVVASVNETHTAPAQGKKLSFTARNQLQNMLNLPRYQSWSAPG